MKFNAKTLSRFLLILLGTATLVSILGLHAESHLEQVLQSPSLDHWMGTDALGRDLFTRVLQANFYSWVVGLGAAAMAFAIGTLWGFVAGSGPGAVDLLLMRFVEVLDSIPSVVLVTLFVLLIRAWSGDQLTLRLFALIIGIGLTHWMPFARTTRVLVLQERQSAYVEGARALGVGPWRLFWVHLRPHLAPALRQSLWGHLPAFFLFESLLSFLGFGLQPPQTSLGILLQDGWKSFSVAPHLLLAPGILLVLTLLCLQASFVTRPHPREQFF